MDKFYMYLLYVDESGDTGTINSPTNYFILSGIVVHELRWKIILDELIAFRKQLKCDNRYKLKLREEIHASVFINSPGELYRIKKNDRLDILKKCLKWLASQSDLSIINIVVDKRRNSNDIFEIAWKALIQRFENTIRYGNFPGNRNQNESGIIIPDQTDNKKLQGLIRQMRRYNPIPHNQYYGAGYRNLALEFIVEDPFFKYSHDSYFNQMVDVVAYSIRQLYEPNSYVRRKGASKMANKLDPILCRYASRTHPLGIVEL